MNYQRDRWIKFFRHGIYDLFKEYFKDFVYGGYRITAEPDPSQILPLQMQGEEKEFAPLFVNWTVENVGNVNIAKKIEYPAVKLMDIPLFADDGFKSNNTTFKPVSKLEYASGWYIDDLNGEKRLVYRSKFGRVFIIKENGRVYSASSSRKNVSIMTFLRAVTGKDSSELLDFYGSVSGFIKYAFTERYETREEACLESYNVLFGDSSNRISVSNIVPAFCERLFGYATIRSGSEKIPRYLDMESYHRCHGMKIVDCKNARFSDVFKDSTTDIIITPELAERMDKDPILTSCCVVDNNNHQYLIKRCYADKFTNNLSPDEILYAYYQFLLYLDGLGEAHDGQELSNLVLEPIDKVAARSIETHLHEMIKKIISNINSNSINILVDVDKIAYNEKEKGSRKDIMSILSASNTNRTADITNIVSEVDLSGKIKREEANSQRDVHPSHYGRLDMNDTPESEEVGLTISLCSHSDIDEHGFVTVPVYPVINGKTDRSKTVMLSYLDEKWKYIAPVECDLDAYEDNDLVPNCTLNGRIVSALKVNISYQRRQSEDYYGSTLNAVPGVTWNGTKRFTLASSAYKQACPLLKPERPYVTTGFAKNDSGIVRTQDIIREHLASLGKECGDISKNVVLTLTSWNDKERVVVAEFVSNMPIGDVTTFYYTVLGMTHSLNKTMREYKLVPSKNNDKQYSYNEIVFRSNDISLTKRHVDIVTKTPGGLDADSEKKIEDHDIALGQNLKVLYKTFNGYGYEDSVVFNQRFVDQFGLATVSTVSIKMDNKKTTGGKKIIFRNVSNCDWITDEGLPVIGTYLKPGDVVIEYSYENEEQPQSKKLTATQEGYVWYANKIKRNDHVEVEVVLVRILPMDVGDKITGGHGNKATCSIIVPEHEMPYTEDGETPDVIFNPLGCISRENVGQLTECLLAEMGRQTNSTMLTNLGVSMNPDEIVAKAKECSEATGCAIERKTLYNPETGEPFKEKCFIGTMHVVRSTHTCFSKYMAIGSSKGKISKDGQPIKKGAEHAQRISELTTWAYRASGASEVLDTLFTIQSDDAKNRDEMMRYIHEGKEYDGPYESINGFRMEAYLRFFGINMDVDENNQIFLEPIDSEKAKAIANNNVINEPASNKNDDLNRTDVFGPMSPKASEFENALNKYGLIKIGQSFINPIFLNSTDFTRCIPTLKCMRKKTKSKDSISYTYAYEGLKPSEIKSIANTSDNNKRRLYFGLVTGDSYIELSSKNNVGLKTLKGVFFLTDNPHFDEDWISNLGCGMEHFFSVIRDYKHYSLKQALVYYNQIYNPNAGDDLSNTFGIDLGNGFDLDIDDTMYRDMTKTEDVISYEESQRTESEDDDITVESHSMVDAVSYGYDSMMKLAEMLYCSGYTLKSFMTDYVIAPPLVLRPVSEEDNATYRSFSKVLSVIYDCAHDVERVYRRLAEELKPPKKKDSAKTVITELTSHRNKTSIIRDKCLAKTVAYSGRSVISVDPTLKLGECKVPTIMLTTIFMDHLLHLIDSNKDSELYKMVMNNGTAKKFYKDRARLLVTGIATCDLASAVDSLKVVSDFMTHTSREGIEVSIKEKQEKFEVLKKELYDMLNTLMETHPCILSRDPALWEFSVRGHRVIPSNGYTIKIHPLVCKGFNADFDGDQMSAIFPMHKKAKQSLGKNMMVGSALINPQNGKSIFVFEQDLLLGHFYATKDEPCLIDENNNWGNYVGCFELYDTDVYVDDYKHPALISLYDKIDMNLCNYSDSVIAIYKGRKYLTTVGRLMFNTLYPMTYTFTEEFDDVLGSGYYRLKFGKIDKKSSDDFTHFILDSQQKPLKVYGDVYKSIIDDVPSEGDYFCNEHGLAKTIMNVADRLMRFGIVAADNSGTTLSYWDFQELCDNKVYEAIDNATNEAKIIATRRSLGLLDDNLANAMLRDLWGEVQKESEDILKKKLAGSTNLFNIIESGARGSVANLNHICGFIGTVVNASGEEMVEPIKGNYLKGLSNGDVSINSFDNRRIKLQTQGGSASSGEKTRKLVYILEHFRIGHRKICDANSTPLKIYYNQSGDKWVMDVAHKDMIWYRTLDAKRMKKAYGDDVNSVIDKCIKDTSLNGYVNYIMTQEAIAEIEAKHLHTVYFYTMINCEERNSDGEMDGKICPRCFGYRYQDARYPEEDEPIGYTVAGSIGEKGVQAAQNLHKSGSSGKKNINIYSDNATYALQAPMRLNEKVSMLSEDDIEEYYLSVIDNCYNSMMSDSTTEQNKFYDIIKEHDFVFERHLANVKNDSDLSIYDTVDIWKNSDNKGAYKVHLRAFTKKLSSVSKFKGTVCVFNLDDTKIITVLSDENPADYTWFPIWNNALEVCIKDGDVVNAGDALVKMPSIKDFIEATYAVPCSDVETDYASKSNLAMTMWYTKVRTVSVGSFVARNFELTTRAYNEVGMAMTSDVLSGHIAGQIYPVYELKNLGIEYKPALMADYQLGICREKVMAAMAKGYFAAKAPAFVVRKIKNEQTSSISDAVAGINRAENSYPIRFEDLEKIGVSVGRDLSDIVASSFQRASSTAIGIDVDKADIKTIGSRGVESTDDDFIKMEFEDDTVITRHSQTVEEEDFIPNVNLGGIDTEAENSFRGKKKKYNKKRPKDLFEDEFDMADTKSSIKDRSTSMFADDSSKNKFADDEILSGELFDIGFDEDDDFDFIGTQDSVSSDSDDSFMSMDFIGLDEDNINKFKRHSRGKRNK